MREAPRGSVRLVVAPFVPHPFEECVLPLFRSSCCFPPSPKTTEDLSWRLAPGDEHRQRCGIHYRNNKCIGRALVLSLEHRLRSGIHIFDKLTFFIPLSTMYYNVSQKLDRE